MQTSKNKYPLELLIKAAEYLKRDHSLKETAEQFNIPYGTLKGALVRHGLRKPSHKVKNISWKRDAEITYFDSIDSHEKAYYLGFIYADGSISLGNYPDSRVFTMCLQKQDDYILQRLINNFNISTKLYYINNAAKINIYDRHLYDSLINLGVKERKSYKDFKIPNIDKQYLSSFILGYFDGDGCISLSTKGNGKFAHVAITCNSKVFLEDIQNVLFKENIKSSIRTVQKPTGILYVLEIGKKLEYLKFGDYIYSNYSNSLIRKKDKFNLLKKNNNYGVTNI